MYSYDGKQICRGRWVDCVCVCLYVCVCVKLVVGFTPWAFPTPPSSPIYLRTRAALGGRQCGCMLKVKPRRASVKNCKIRSFSFFKLWIAVMNAFKHV